MANLQKLKEFGWFLSEDGLKKVLDDCKIVDVKEIIKRALDIDLRDISTGGLPDDFGKLGKYDSSGTILQILKIRNISAPKCNEESKAAPRLLQIDFTDGRTFCNGLEFERIQSLSLNTPPGTKITLKGSVKIVQGIMLLTSSNVQVCGGVVTGMIEKWESQRALAKYGTGIKMNTSGGGPPPWIPFGQKSQYQAAGKSFQSLNGDKPKEITKEMAEFLNTRNDAIAEATKLKKRKTFGGGSRQLVDYNVKRIMDKGYSEEDAKNSLKFTRNNVEKAMGNLKRRNDKIPTAEPISRSSFTKNLRDDRMGRKGGKEVDSVESSKPSTQVSLFDFLTDKLKLPQTTTAASTGITTTTTTVPMSSGSSGVISSNQKPIKSNPFRSSTTENNNVTKRNAFKSSTDDSFLNRQSQPSNQASKSLVSSGSYNEMTAEEQRSKFENNISASFANRQQRRDDEPTKGGGGGSGDGGYSSRHSLANTTKLNNQNTSSYPSNSRYNHNRNTNSAPPPSSNSRQSYVAPNAVNDNFHQSSKSAKIRQPDNKNKTSRYDDNSKAQNAYYQSTQDKRLPASAINQLANETAAMKISNTKNARQSSQQQQPQKQHQQKSHHNNSLQSHQQQPLPQTKNAFEKVFPQMPNGFEYNPYKIMGFQNKETNEFAKTVLKTQNFENIPQQGNSIPIAMPMVPSPQPPSHPSMMAAQMQMPDAYITMQNFIKSPPLLASQHYTAASPPGGQLQATMTPVITAPYNWIWKCNDCCFAKYWEDGRYYHAEITGMSNKTCVVQFMEYGNFEEVLLTDCIPITEANIKLINQYNANLLQQQTMHYGSAAAPSTGSQSTQQQQQQQQHLHSRVMRNDQQMYMPPAQRSNK